jgi:lysozyme
MDTEGFRTIGWGHKVVYEDKFEDGKTYTKEELQDVFDKDLQKAIGQARQLMEEHGVADLPTTAQHTITEMVYQLGKSGVSKFRNMWKCLQNRDFNGASLEMLDSKWNRQTPNRCKKLSDQMKSCA